MVKCLSVPLLDLGVLLSVMWGAGIVICLQRGVDLHAAQLSLASVKSRLVLPFWCRLTR